MCGIAGIVVFHNAFEPELSMLQTMCNSIVHRGPDSEGMDIRDGIALGMRRLSIIDLEGGNQPIFNEDQSIRTVFNGEIYNFRELRSELESKGHIFRTNADTEVIVHAYEEYGNECPKLFNGMFAFALHDSIRKKFMLVRDQIGIKPLYYSFSSTHLLFGSEIKTILASGLIKKKTLDLNSLGEFLAWEYIPGQGTLLHEVRKLEPGQVLEIDLQKPDCHPRTYWDVPDIHEDISLTPEQWIEELNQKISNSVRRQLISDVPLGAFLSGGVDSSLVVASMDGAKTFSIGFQDSTYDELPWARRVANHLKTVHQDKVIRPDITDLFFKLMYFMDDPIGDFSIFPTYLVSQFARRHVTVALSGDGGDELFGGYETYAAQNMAQKYSFVPRLLRNGLVEPLIRSLRPRPQKKGLVNKAKRFIEGFDQCEDLGHARWRQFFSDSIRRELFSPDVFNNVIRPSSNHILELFRRAENRQGMNRSLYVDFKSYLPDNCLVKVDRMSMAVSLEARVPLLDVDLVETAFRMPAELKVKGMRTKVLLKRVAALHIPEEIVYRPKQGFSIPIKSWLKGELRPLMEELLSTRRIHDQGLFQPSFVEQLKKDHLAGIANNSHIIWSLIVFQAWYDSWL